MNYSESFTNGRDTMLLRNAFGIAVRGLQKKELSLSEVQDIDCTILQDLASTLLKIPSRCNSLAQEEVFKRLNFGCYAKVLSSTLLATTEELKAFESIVHDLPDFGLFVYFYLVAKCGWEMYLIESMKLTKVDVVINFAAKAQSLIVLFPSVWRSLCEGLVEKCLMDKETASCERIVSVLTVLLNSVPENIEYCYQLLHLCNFLLGKCKVETDLWNEWTMCDDAGIVRLQRNHNFSGFSNIVLWNTHLIDEQPQIVNFWNGLMKLIVSFSTLKDSFLNAQRHLKCFDNFCIADLCPTTELSLMDNISHMVIALKRFVYPKEIAVILAVFLDGFNSIVDQHKEDASSGDDSTMFDPQYVLDALRRSQFSQDALAFLLSQESLMVKPEIVEFLLTNEACTQRISQSPFLIVALDRHKKSDSLNKLRYAVYKQLPETQLVSVSNYRVQEQRKRHDLTSHPSIGDDIRLFVNRFSGDGANNHDLKHEALVLCCLNYREFCNALLQHSIVCGMPASDALAQLLAYCSRCCAIPLEEIFVGEPTSSDESFFVDLSQRTLTERQNCVALIAKLAAYDAETPRLLEKFPLVKEVLPLMSIASSTIRSSFILAMDVLKALCPLEAPPGHASCRKSPFFAAFMYAADALYSASRKLDGRFRTQLITFIEALLSTHDRTLVERMLSGMYPLWEYDTITRVTLVSLLRKHQFQLPENVLSAEESSHIFLTNANEWKLQLAQLDNESGSEESAVVLLLPNVIHWLSAATLDEWRTVYAFIRLCQQDRFPEVSALLTKCCIGVYLVNRAHRHMHHVIDCFAQIVLEMCEDEVLASSRDHEAVVGFMQRIVRLLLFIPQHHHQLIRLLMETSRFLTPPKPLGLVQSLQLLLSQPQMTDVMAFRLAEQLKSLNTDDNDDGIQEEMQEEEEDNDNIQEEEDNDNIQELSDDRQLSDGEDDKSSDENEANEPMDS